jgi:5-methylcytosine-specific restriction protein B
MGYFKELNKFLAQAKTDDLGTTRNNYLQKYLGLEIKISFGQGGSAKIPWISFLGNGQTTSNGIYPVYLYFKAENLLVLAYGISVTNTPSKKWDLKNPKTISEYFVENKLGTPFNYGNSFIFKTYSTNQLPTSSVIDGDLNEILSYYKSIDLISNLKSTQKTIFIAMNNLTTKLVSIKTKPFIILAGLSGTGKSRLVRTLAYQFNNIAADIAAGKNPPTNFQLVKVKPNWHDSSELLGYESRISGKDRFIATDFIRFIIKAWHFPETPFFLCLDEMNLAPVEQYFAEYLSAIETRRINSGKIKTDSLISSKLISKYANKENGVDVTYELWNELELTNTGIQEELKANGLGLPSNLIVMGTVNMDETTHSFSRKVLDRAMTIEMNDINLSEGLSASADDWNYPAEPLNKELVLSEKTQGSEIYEALNTAGVEIIKYLDLINIILEGSPFKIAYRVRDEFLLFAFNYSLLEDKPSDWMKKVLDEMTLMKILPRIEGDEDRTKLLDDLIILFQENNLQKSMNKATEMANRRRLSHYTSFWS